MVNLAGVAAAAAVACPPICHGNYPKLLIAGDSTVSTQDGARYQGWGKHVGKYLNLHVMNQAKNGRSTRSYVNDGYWAKLLELVLPGDFVLLEFGHNDDGDPTNSSNTRAFRNTLPGIGDEKVDVVYSVNASALGAQQGNTPVPTPKAAAAKGAAPGLAGLAALIQNTTVTKRETVHTYGWYLKNMIVDVRDKGGVPVLSGMVPRYRFSSNASDAVLNTTYPFSGWSHDVAVQLKTPWVDHTYHTLLELWKLGPVKSKELYPQDNTHTSDRGAKIFAETFIRALKCGNSSMARYVNNQTLEFVSGGCLDARLLGNGV